MEWVAKLVEILVVLLLGWDENNSTLQENQIKINASLGIKNPPHHSGKRKTNCEIIFYASGRAGCGRGVSVWKQGVEGDFHYLYQEQISTAQEPCSQNLGESRV